MIFRSWARIFWSFLVLFTVNSKQSDNRINIVMKNSKFGGYQALEFCHGCPNPHLEGSRMLGLGAVHGPIDYRIHGEMKYAIPNQAHGGKLLNANQLKGRVVLVDRGRIPLLNKVLIAQAAGAIGVVIADDGRLNFFLFVDISISCLCENL